jgi:hypothetical protein
MKSIILGIFLLCLCAAQLAANQHQVGTAASGQAKSAELRLQSVLGQNASGHSGSITSGFLSVSMATGFLPGDVNGNGEIDISDAVYLIGYIFGGGPAPSPLARGDVDCSKGVDISDAVFLISYIFGGGSAPHHCL